MDRILRVDADPGLLTNRRMALEVAVGLSHLTGRRLSMPWADRIGGAPGPRPASGPDLDDRPRTLDLWEVPVDVVDDDEWDSLDPATAVELPWGPYGFCVYLADDRPVPHPGLRDFAHGRTRFVRVPDDESPAYWVRGRPLSFTSLFFHATGDTRRSLLGAVGGVRLREPYQRLGEAVARDLGPHNVAHIRRTDLVRGVRAYAGVSPEHIAATLAEVLPTDELLVIATEADPASSLFDPVRVRFAHVEFLSDVILGDHAEAFGDLPFHEDNALGAVTQVVASLADRFVGTMSSTFTALIHRLRCQRDPRSPFWYTADFTPDGPTFREAAYQEVLPGRYTWNRIGLAIDPENLAWQREWPEAVTSPDDGPGDDALDRPTGRRADDGLAIHTVVCTDTNPYGDWQCRFQEHTWHRVSQPGELVRLLACPDGERPPATEHARVVTTAARNDHPDAPEDYAGFNRLWSLQEWLQLERPRGTVLVLDADMVFRSPIRTEVARGEIVVQEWHGIDASGLWPPLAPVTRAAPDDIEPFTWPMLVDCDDLAALVPRWIELTAALRRTTGMWESDMFALVAAVAEAGLAVRYETLGAWLPWPEAFVAGAPTIHYCQPVEARDGRRLWFKQDYTPWEPLGVDPNEANLDYARDLLHLLDEFVRRQRGAPIR